MASPFPIPLNAVRAIEIVARRGALAPAAEELGVTPGAVESQHLRRAGERLGHELFERTPQGLRPTPALRQILPQPAPASPSWPMRSPCCGRATSTC